VRLGLPVLYPPLSRAVWQRFLLAVADAAWCKLRVTMFEVLMGLLAGVSCDIGWLPAGKVAPVRAAASPFLVASQAIPIVAIARCW